MSGLLSQSLDMAGNPVSFMKTTIEAPPQGPEPPETDDPHEAHEAKRKWALTGAVWSVACPWAWAAWAWAAWPVWAAWGMAGYGGGMGGHGGGMGGFGGMVVYSEMALPSATVLTIRAKKSDVGDFARGELDFEQFQKTVEIFTY